MSGPAPTLPERERDALTGLPGIEAARARLGEWQRAHGAGGEKASVHALLLGFRRFDTVNLAYGASGGDMALAEVASRLSGFAAAELEGPWLAARTGGSNFLLIANEACSRERWQVFASGLADFIARPVMLAGETARLTPRFALLRALIGEHDDSLIDRLGQTLESSLRQQGRRLLWADGEATRPGRTSAQMEADLLKALDRGEIEVVYQPQFSSATGALTGAEALARWNHPRLGRLGAGSLFSVAERADHIGQVSRHIARLALDGAQGWPDDLRLSLNVTATDLGEADFPWDLLRIIAESGFPPARLTLEVTEQALLSDIQLAARSLELLAAAGIGIALDDFGAGFCNFRYLKLLPLDALKLDRSMIEGLGGDARDLAVLRGIVAMARALGLKVIAEGIENEAQREVVAREGCEVWQGFLGAQPMARDDFRELAKTGLPKTGTLY